MSGLAKSTIWSRLSVKCRHTLDLSEWECYLSLLIRLRLFCPIEPESQGRVNLYTTPCSNLPLNFESLLSLPKIAIKFRFKFFRNLVQVI